jgi:hypothetical protein
MIRTFARRTSRLGRQKIFSKLGCLWVNAAWKHRSGGSSNSWLKERQTGDEPHLKQNAEWLFEIANEGFDICPSRMSIR